MNQNYALISKEITHNVIIKYDNCSLFFHKCCFLKTYSMVQHVLYCHMLPYTCLIYLIPEIIRGCSALPWVEHPKLFSEWGRVSTWRNICLYSKLQNAQYVGPLSPSTSKCCPLLPLKYSHNILPVKVSSDLEFFTQMFKISLAYLV